MPLTNKAFGDRIGITHSMASRIRNGKRAPGLATIEAISKEYGISLKTLIDAKNRGDEAFGRLITTKIFDPVEKAEKAAEKAEKASARKAATAKRAPAKRKAA
jgi:transcriptional regulator with XRE-family HTH domain